MSVTAQRFCVRDQMVLMLSCCFLDLYSQAGGIFQRVQLVCYVPNASVNIPKPQ